MAKVKAVRFHSDYCAEGQIRFNAGKVYQKNAETERCIALNFGEIVTVDEGELSIPNATAAERRSAQEREAVAQKAAAEKVAKVSAAKAVLVKAEQDLESARQEADAKAALIAAESDESKKAELQAAADAARSAEQAASDAMKAAQDALDDLLAG